MRRLIVDLATDFQDLPFDVSKHSEAFDSFAALNLLPQSIEPTLRARDLIFVRVPSCKFRIGVTGDPGAQEEIENNHGGIAFEIIYRADDPIEAHQVRGEVERYFLRHYPGRTLRSANEAGAEAVTGDCVYVTCQNPVSPT